MKFETRAIHEGQEPDPATGAVIVPVYQTSTYEQEEVGKHKGFEYSRTGNPTRKALEQALASLENGKYGLAFASGVAATAAILSVLKVGDDVVSGSDIYGGTYRLFEKVFKQWGLDVTYADIDDGHSFEKAIKKNTKLIWVETPTNPLLKIIDIKNLANTAKKNGILLAVDNTFASPYFQRPIELGADIVVHSTTKYIAGHSDVIGGAVITSNESFFQNIKFYQNAIGAVPGPWDSWLTLRGVKTLSVRMREHEKNASSIARFLEGSKNVERVYYPGLTSHKGHGTAKLQMDGYGGIVSLEIKGGKAEAKKFIAGLKIFTLAESLGGVESLVCYPSEMTHASIPQKERFSRGIKDNLIRLSVGIEHKKDLLVDLEKALKNII